MRENFEALKIILKVSVLATSLQGYSGLDEWFLEVSQKQNIEVEADPSQADL